MSPAQLKESVSTASDLLDHALKALEEKRTSSIGPMASEKQGPLLKADAQAALDKIQKWAKSTGAPSTPAAPAAPPASTSQEGAIAHNPKTGETIIRQNGKWVPLS